MHQVQQQPQPGTTVLYSAAGQPVAISLPQQPSTYQSYKSQQSMIAGILLMVSGVLSIAFNAAGIALRESMAYGGHGIWCGVMVSKCAVRCFSFLK